MKEAGLAKLASLAANKNIQDLTKLLASDRGGPWLVGGAVRDFVLGRRPAGFDFLAARDVLTVVPALAKELDAQWEMTDRSFRHATIKREEGVFTLTNLSSAETLEENLSRRDYTVNSLALDLPSLFASPIPKVIDLREGWNDLASKTLQPCTWRGLLDEPARILRGLRLESQLGFALPSIARSQVTSGQVRSLNEMDHEFWEELLFLLALRDEAIEKRLVDFELAPKVLKLPCATQKAARGGVALQELRGLLAPLSWSRRAQRELVASLDEEWGQEVRFLLLLGAEKAAIKQLRPELESIGTPAQLLERLEQLLSCADGLKNDGLPWNTPLRKEISQAECAAALLLGSSALADVQEGSKSVPAGPEPGTLVRRSLSELLRQRVS